MMTESQQLLLDYARNGSETAFRGLVTRYIDLVFSTALRLADGDVHRAEDVAQTVFLDLARQASKLSEDSMLGGWLHRDTCFVAAKLMRSERRRQIRERQAAEMKALENTTGELEQIAPVLDEAINELSEEDRQAIVLRFYERMDFRSVGLALGSSENAAQKRVSRALEQLHSILTRRGSAVSAAALGAVLAADAVKAAPLQVAATITAKVLASTGAATGTALAVKKVVAPKLIFWALGVCGLTVLALLMWFLFAGPKPPPKFEVRLSGTAGLRFTGTMVLDGVSTNLSGIVPATYLVNGRNLRLSFKKTEAAGQLSLAISARGKTLGSSTTSSPFAGVLSEIRDYGLTFQKTMFTTF